MTALVDALVRRCALKTFPYCPAEAADHFTWLLHQPAQLLVAAASTTLAKPYGINRILMTGADFGISFACIEPGQGTSLHYHRRRREMFCVRAGRLHLVNGGREMDLAAGDFGASTPGVAHSLSNEGDGTLEVLEMFSPALLEDKVRIRDRYGRSTGTVGLYE